MKQSILLISIYLFAFQIGNAQTIEEQKHKLDSYELRNNHDYDRIIKFTRLTSDQTISDLKNEISKIDIDAKVTYNRGESGELETLKFSNKLVACSCAKNDVGIVYITIKDDKINGCGAVDFSGLLKI